jgi:cytochrome P450
MNKANSWPSLIAILTITLSLLNEVRLCEAFVLRQNNIPLSDRSDLGTHTITSTCSGSICGILSSTATTTSPQRDVKPIFTKTSTMLQMLPSPQQPQQIAIPIISKTLKRMLVAATSMVLVSVLNYRRILWPGSSPDKAYSEPLPPGKLGCPFLGVSMNLYDAFNTTNTKDEYANEKTRLDDFKKLRMKFVYAFLSPMVTVSGKKNVRAILNSEFDEGGAKMTTFAPNERKLLGGNSILYSKNKEEHGFFRRLVGNAMTPSSVSKALPQLQQIATEHVNQMLKSYSTNKNNTTSTVIGQAIFNDYTIEVAEKLILGLDLTKDEKISFKTKMDTWIDHLLSFRTLFFPGLRFTKGWKARQFLVKIIKEKIALLEKHGPDGSTLSSMVFATDDVEDGNNKGNKYHKRSLSQEEIIDNVLFLMLAGSETSSSTLTNCLLLLGLHPHVWDKIVQEQRELCEANGEKLTKNQLDNDCPYLEAAIKETMRLKPISGGQFRRTKQTMIVDGMQIPKGWPVVYNVRLTHELDSSTFLEDGSHMDLMEGFKPERWLDETTRPRDGDYMPFGSGPRYCLGATLAMAEMKTFLAIMARNVHFDIVGVDADNIEWKRSDLIAIPKDGVIVAIRPSSKNFVSM